MNTADNRREPLTDPVAIGIYLASEIADYLHVDIPDNLTATFQRITDLFNAKTGPFMALVCTDPADLYARAYGDVRMAISATWYNLKTFEMLCSEVENRVFEAARQRHIAVQVDMNTSIRANKLCFEYEHFMFHQKSTVDRIAHFFLTYFGQRGDSMHSLQVKVEEIAKRSDLSKQRYALALSSTIKRHQSFLDSIHSASSGGKGRTERDRFTHKHFIPFANPIIWLRPGESISMQLQVTTDRKTVERVDARDLLRQRYKQVEDFTKDMLDSFLDP